jgi:hypothetical protein
VIVKSQPPPAKVSGIAAVSGEIRCVPLSWEAHPDLQVQKYILYRKDSEEGAFKEIAVIKGRQKKEFLDGKKNPGNLLDQHTYYYTIYAVNEVGSVSAEADVIPVTTRSIPPQVTSLTAVSGQARQVTLSWARSADEKVCLYQIWRADGKNPFTKIAELKGLEQTTYVDTGTGRAPLKGLGKLLDDCEYQYKMITMNIAGILSEASPVVTAKTKPVPAAPVSLKGEWGGARIELSWMANPEPDIREYRIEFGKGSPTPPVGFSAQNGKPIKINFKKLTVIPVTPGQTSFAFSHEGISVKEIYSYQIKAVTQDGIEGLCSEPVTVTPPPVENLTNTIPAAPGVKNPETKQTPPKTGGNTVT